jgi:uncharacterized protein (DUF2141 family)
LHLRLPDDLPKLGGVAQWGGEAELNLLIARSLAVISVSGIFALAAGPVSAQGGAPAGCSGKPSATWVNVTVEGLRNGKGILAMSPYPDDPSRFLKPNSSLQTGRVPAKAGVLQTCIFVPAPGAYGLAIYHDENANGKVDRNGLGIPKEGFGFSNNPRIFFSAPSFKKVRFQVPAAGTSIRIKMKYP